MRSRTLVSSAIVLLLFPGRAARAQEPASPTVVVSPSGPVAGEAPLTIADAIAEALAANPDLAAVQAARLAAEARPAIERTLMPPMLEAEVFQWPTNTANPADAQFMFTMQQDLPGRGKRALRAARATEEAAMAANEVDQRRVQVVAEVKEAFVRILAGRRVLDLLGESVELVRQLGAAAEVKYAAGRISQQEVVRALLERTRLQRDQLSATEEVRMAEARLNALLGRAPAAPVGPLVCPLRPALPPLEVAQSFARDHQPALIAPHIEKRLADADLAVIAGDRKPDWTLRGGYMLMPNETNALTARVGVTWPGAPWSSRRLDAEQRAAQARRAAADARARAAERQVGRAAEEAWVRAQAAQEREDLVRGGLLPQAQHALDLARLGYETDRVSLVDVIDAARSVADVRRDLVRAEEDRDLALISLELAVGTDLPAAPGGEARAPIPASPCPSNDGVAR